MAGFLSSLKDLVKWESLQPWLPEAWVLKIAVGSVIGAYLVYKAVRILRTDCDLTLLSKRLKPLYFSGKVVWVTGASSGSKFCRYTRST